MNNQQQQDEPFYISFKYYLVQFLYPLFHLSFLSFLFKQLKIRTVDLLRLLTLTDLASLYVLLTDLVIETFFLSFFLEFDNQLNKNEMKKNLVRD